MSDGFKVLRKAGKIAATLAGATLGFAAGGPLGAVAGAGIGNKAGKKILSVQDRVLGTTPKAQQPETGVPTYDTAAANQQVSDRLRMRKGVLANIYGGASGGSPNTATKTLLGS